MRWTDPKLARDKRTSDVKNAGVFKRNPLGDPSVGFTRTLPLLPWQQEVDDIFQTNPLLGGDGPDTFVYACTRRAGKDVLAFQQAVQMCLTFDHFSVLYLNITQEVVKRAILMGTWQPSSPDDPGEFLGLIPKGVFPDMDELDCQRWHSKAVNLNECTLTFPNGSRIIFKGADKLTARGLNIDMAVMSEYAFYKDHERVDSIVLSMLQKRTYVDDEDALEDRSQGGGGGITIYASTGDGDNKYARIAQGQEQKAGKTYSLIMPYDDPRFVTANGRPIITKEDLLAEIAAGKLTRAIMRREFEVSFESAVYGSVFGDEYEFMLKNDRIVPHIHYKPSQFLRTGWDLGSSHPTVVLVAQEEDGMHYFIKEFEFKQTTYKRIASSINEWLATLGTENMPAKWSCHFLPWDAAKSNNQYGDLMETAEYILNDAGLRDTYITRKVTKKEHATEAMREPLYNNIVISQSGCPKLVRALKEYRYRRTGNERFDNKPDQRHWSADYVDALQSYTLGILQRFGPSVMKRRNFKEVGPNFYLDAPGGPVMEAHRLEMERQREMMLHEGRYATRKGRLSWMAR